MNQHFIPASFYRGGSSKGLFFHARDLPVDIAKQDAIFLAAMGSPDPNGRQLDGMGGGVSSLSKVVIIGPSTHKDADIDYTFGQVSVDKAIVDRGANCGNMSSAVGPFAIDEGLVAATDGTTLVRIHQVNTQKIIHAHIPVRNGKALSNGDFEIAGVSGSGAKIRLDFLSPEGSVSSGLLPSGKTINKITLGSGQILEVSLVDASNPVVFVKASDLGLSNVTHPNTIEASHALMATLDEIRRKGAVLMGLSTDPEAAPLANPKIAMVFAPADFQSLDHSNFPPDSHDIGINMLSMERVHRAVTLTGAMCAGVARQIAGTVPHQLCRHTESQQAIRIGNPSGIVDVQAKVLHHEEWSVEYASVYRTARCLMKGAVAVPSDLL